MNIYKLVQLYHKKKTPFDHNQTQTPNQNLNPNPRQSQPEIQQQQTQQQKQHQPPVYNINKNDFRDVVQKLIGSPTHKRFSSLLPIHAPKPSNPRVYPGAT